VSNGGFTDEELDYLAEKIVDTFIDRAREFVERVEVSLDKTKKHREESKQERRSGV
jgi:hypothetical protein